MNKQCYKVNLRERITNGELSTFVYAGCLEEAEDLAKSNFEEHIDPEDLEILSVQVSKEGIKWEQF